MAPALTEPISQSKLSSSATSGASPRTGSSSTSMATPSDVSATQQTPSNNNNNNNNSIKPNNVTDYIELALEELHNGPSIDEQVTTESSAPMEALPPEDGATEACSSSSSQQQIPPESLPANCSQDSQEMEQMLGDLAGTSDLELLQVFKSLDSVGNLGLFNDMDMMNMCDDIVVSSQTSPIKEKEKEKDTNKDKERMELHAEIRKRQAAMVRKYDFLMRRLSKLQARYMGQHVSEEISGLFDYSQRHWKKREKEVAKNSSLASISSIPDLIPYSAPVQSDKTLKPVSASAMKTFVKRLESVSNTQSQTLSHKLHNSKYFGQESAEAGPSKDPLIPGTSSTAGNFLPKFEDRTVYELEQTAGLLESEMRVIQSAIDSDATLSSSGGESADELITYNNQHQESVTIAKRAAWRWAKDRASVASRWTWLLAQISDLEYRIRQHNELHCQIRKSKGAVTFDDAANQPAQQSVNGYRGVLPGNSKDDAILTSGTEDTENLGSCRTRPFHRHGFRKRRLLQTANLHTISKKASRSSTIKCGCQWPLHPCALCTGRADPTAPRDLPDTMPASDRIALLDPGFHHVLSFPQDVLQCIHYEAIMRIPEWQNKAIRCTAKAAMKGALAAQKAAANLSEYGDDSFKKIGVDGRRKHNNNKASFNRGLNRLKKGKSRRGLSIPNSFVNNRYKASSTVTSGALTSKSALHKSKSRKSSSNYDFFDGQHADGMSASSRSKNSSPTPNHIFRSDRLTSDSRRSRNSYDIDNIVIPYSVAASTRVELLPYKEIATPKWRIVDENETVDSSLIKINNKLNNSNNKRNTSQQNIKNNNNNNNNNGKKVTTSPPQKHQSATEDEEDVSDDVLLQKHERALLEERKKFQSHLKYPWKRSRNRRIDSRAESSGANTPDPTSPAPATPNVVGDLESVPPSPAAPSTPITPFDGQELSESNIVNALNQSIHGKKERRRTVSSKKNEEMRRSNSPDIKELIPPYEPYNFPLDDVAYENMLSLMPSNHIALVQECIDNMMTTPKSTNNRLIFTSKSRTALSSNLSTSTTLSATENDLDDADLDEMANQNEFELEQAKKIEKQLIMEKLLNSCENRMRAGLGGAVDSEETDTGESLFADEEDPNDPEWYEAPGRGRL